MDERERKKGNACLPGVIVRQLGSQISAVAGKPKFRFIRQLIRQKKNCEEKYPFLRSKGNSERKGLDAKSCIFEERLIQILRD